MKYPLPNYKHFSLDYEGNMTIKEKKHPKRKKLLKTLSKIGIFVGGVWVGKELTK